MRIAIATDGNNVSQHFGQCDCYTLFDNNNKSIENKQELASPAHQPGILPEFLKKHGVECIIAGGMGRKAQQLFEQYNIQTYIGVQGAIDAVIEEYLNGTLKSDGTVCTHEDGHYHHT